MKFDDVFKDLFAKVLSRANDEFLLQHGRNVFAPICFEGQQVTDGKNLFKVELTFTPCEGADAMPSTN